MGKWACKMRGRKTTLLLEVLIAFIVLALVFGIIGTAFYIINRLYKNLEYRITALNLAREIIEYGEAGKYQHQFAFKYYYPSATSNTIPAEYGCGETAEGFVEEAGYKIKEWRCFTLALSDPFDYLGDIKERKVVPKLAPDSVTIYYRAIPDPDPQFFSAYRETVDITWQLEPNGEEKKETLSVIPITNVNNQLYLTIAEFWWEEE